MKFIVTEMKVFITQISTNKENLKKKKKYQKNADYKYVKDEFICTGM